MQRTSVIIAAVSGFLAVAVAQPSSASGLDVRLGAFFPRAQSDLFTDAQELYGLQKSDWIGISGGMDYNANIAHHFELAVGLDAYYRSNDTSYLRYTRQNDSEIRQSSSLTVLPLSLSLKAVLNPRRGAITPYGIIGIDTYFYDYKAWGDFIDFRTANRDISYDEFRSEGAAFGIHVGAGLRIPVNDDLSITGEGRYHFADEVRMNDDFDANRLDLSGFAVTVGINLRF